MTALRPSTRDFAAAEAVAALLSARAATVDYCTSVATELSHTRLRDLSPLEAMYAYYGSDEAEL